MQKTSVALGLPGAWLLIALSTAAGFLGSWWWVPALTVHFRPHLAAASLVLLALSGITRRPGIGALCIITLAINGAPLLPYLSGGAKAATTANLRVLELNMHGAGTSRRSFREMVISQRPDLVVLTEMPGDLERIAREVPELPPF